MLHNKIIQAFRLRRKGKNCFFAEKFDALVRNIFLIVIYSRGKIIYKHEVNVL